IVTGMDSTQVQSINSITVNVNPAPLANVGASQTICVGQSVQIGAGATANRSYQWSPATGLSATNISNPTANPTVTTTYTLLETNTVTGCQKSNDVTITVLP